MKQRIVLFYLASCVFFGAQNGRTETATPAGVTAGDGGKASHRIGNEYLSVGMSELGLNTGYQNADADAVAHARLVLGLDLKAGSFFTLSGKFSGNAAISGWSDGAHDRILHAAFKDQGTEAWLQVDSLTLQSTFMAKGVVPLDLAIGRRPVADKRSKEITAYSLGDTPLPHAMNWQMDGGVLSLGLSALTGIPGLSLSLIYGQGFDDDLNYIHYWQYYPTNDEVRTFGYITTFFDNGVTRVLQSFSHSSDVTDGLTGLIDGSFSISGFDTDKNGIYDVYFLDAYSGGWLDRMDPFSQIGSAEHISLWIESKWRCFDWFADAAGSRFSPDRRSLNPFWQFLGKDSLLNDDGELATQTGFSLWAGAGTMLPWTGGRFGVEFNWGSKNWLGFTSVPDPFAMNKLAVRGKVYEVFYRQPFFQNLLLVGGGVQFYDYDHAGSGIPIGKTKDIDAMPPLDTFFLQPGKEELLYLNMSLNW